MCHSDLSANNGAIKVFYPCVLGHEGAGIIESIGEGVTLVKPGKYKSLLTDFMVIELHAIYEK